MQVAEISRSKDSSQGKSSKRESRKKQELAQLLYRMHDEIKNCLSASQDHGSQTDSGSQTELLRARKMNQGTLVRDEYHRVEVRMALQPVLSTLEVRDKLVERISHDVRDASHVVCISASSSEPFLEQIWCFLLI